MLKLLKIAGQSLEPEYQKGDFVLVSRIPFSFAPPRPGDIVAFSHAQYGTMIKRVQSTDNRGTQLFVVGSHPLSVDSRHFGPIERASLIGKVIWHIRKPD